MKPDVLIVGAGPVGIYTAIETKLRNPALAIKMFERKKEYSRNYTLLVKKDSFANAHHDPRLQAILQKFDGPTPTSLIESKLKDLALQLGIKFSYCKITNPAILLDRYPSAHTLVGADGAHSIVRKKLFNEELIHEQSLQHIVEIKYLVNGRTLSIPLLDYLPALTQIKHLVHEQVGKYRHGRTPVSLFFTVDKATYDEVRQQGITELRELCPSTLRMTRLSNSIRPWLALRRYKFSEHYFNNTANVSAVQLATYSSKYFIKQNQNNQRLVLVGDASSGVPYNRSFNAGIIRAIMTAQWLALAPEHGNAQIHDLNKRLHTQVLTEIRRAKITNFKVRLGLSYHKQIKLSIFSGISLDSDILQLMQAEHSTPPSWPRRNPKISTVLFFLLSLEAAFLSAAMALKATGIGLGLPLIGLIFASAWPPVVLAIVLPIIIIGLCVLMFKVYEKIKKQLREKPVHDDHPQAFPWEEDFHDVVKPKKENEPPAQRQTVRREMTELTATLALQGFFRKRVKLRLHDDHGYQNGACHLSSPR